MSYEETSERLRQALEQVYSQAVAAPERVARHWVSVARLTWFGGSADHHLFHVSWSFGALRARPDDPALQTVGVFSVTRAIFPMVDEEGLRRSLQGLVPLDVDGATRVFLLRVLAQWAMADALEALSNRHSVETLLFARPDSPSTPAPAVQWPLHARDRVSAALARLEPSVRARFPAPPKP